MIILNTKKINYKFKENLKKYCENCNYGYFSCPNCYSTDYIRWGSYERNVIYFNLDRSCLESSILKVQRIKCKSCNKTHALLPFGIVPYKQFVDEVISKIIYESFFSNIDILSNKYLIDESTIKRWISQFNKYHFPLLSTLTLYRDKAISLFNYINENGLKYKFIEFYKKCFMQIKISILGITPSYDGVPT